MKRFRRIKSKKGFSLVECVVAIAVFGILASMVFTIIQGAIEGHNSNIVETRSLRKQREELNANVDADGAALVEGRADGDNNLNFNFGGGISAGFKVTPEIAIDKDGKLELTRFSTTSPSASLAERVPAMEASFWKVENVRIVPSVRDKSVLLSTLAHGSPAGLDDALDKLDSLYNLNTKSAYKIPEFGVGNKYSYINNYIDTGCGKKDGLLAGGKYYLNVLQIDLRCEEIDPSGVITKTADQKIKEVDGDVDEFIRINIPKSVVGVIWGAGLNCNPNDPGLITYMNNLNSTRLPSDHVGIDDIIADYYSVNTTAYFGEHPVDRYSSLTNSIMIKKPQGENFKSTYAIGIVTEGRPIADVPFWLNLKECKNCKTGESHIGDNICPVGSSHDSSDCNHCTCCYVCGGIKATCGCCEICELSVSERVAGGCAHP